MKYLDILLLVAVAAVAGSYIYCPSQEVGGAYVVLAVLCIPSAAAFVSYLMNNGADV